MFHIAFYAIASVLLESLVSLLGVIAIPFTGERLKYLTSMLVSLAIGAMLWDAFIHLLPEAFEKGPRDPLRISLCVLGGIMGFFILEKFLHWRHEHTVDENKVLPVGWMSLFAGSLDNFVDGLVIGSAYLVSIPLGFATTIAIVLHEIPKEMGEFGVLIHSGFSKPKAVFFNFMTAVVSLAGTIVALVVGHAVSDFPALVTPFAAGIFIYISGSDLIPQLHQELKPSRSLAQLLAIVLGLGVMVLVKLME